MLDELSQPRTARYTDRRAKITVSNISPAATVQQNRKNGTLEFDLALPRWIEWKRNSRSVRCATRSTSTCAEPDTAPRMLMLETRSQPWSLQLRHSHDKPEFLLATVHVGVFVFCASQHG